MSDPILCHECGHDIDEHQQGYACDVCCIEAEDNAAIRDDRAWDMCRLTPSFIARAYADNRVREAMDSHRCDEQAERAHRRAITAEADARRLHTVRDEVAAEATLARQAHRSYGTDHFAHDYCRWVGMSEAYHNVINILDRRDDA